MNERMSEKRERYRALHIHTTREWMLYIFTGKRCGSKDVDCGGWQDGRYLGFSIKREVLGLNKLIMYIRYYYNK